MGDIVKRLTGQLRERGIADGGATAKRLLTKFGNLKDGKLTPQGEKRQAMGNAGRAKDRAAKYSGNKSSDYKYDAKTNLATKK